MFMYSTSDFRKGLRVLYQNDPYEIVEFEHHKPGKGASVVRTRLKHLLTGLLIDVTFRSGDKVGVPDIEEFEVTFLYSDDNFCYFVKDTTYEQYEIQIEKIKQETLFLVEGIQCILFLYKSNPTSIDLPKQVVLTVEECTPAVRGDTIGNAMKEVKLNTGLKCQVPLFINQGDKIKIDTKTITYVGRI